MPRILTANMQAHLGDEVTRLATVWKITRVDGLEFFFTDHDRDIVFDSDTYLASAGFERSAIVTDVTFSVDNLDLVGVLGEAADGGIEADDVRAGKFDGAEITVALVRWDAPDDGGLIKLRRGTLGETRLTPHGYFRAELRGLAQPLAQNTLELYAPSCRADLGDHRCRFPIAPPVLGREQGVVLGSFYRVATGAGDGWLAYQDRIYEVTTAGTTAAVAPTYDTTVGEATIDGTAGLTARDAFMRTATIATVTTRRTFTLDDSLDAYEDGWFDEGALTWETGASAGSTTEIKSWVQATRQLGLWQPAPLEVEAGDRLRLYPGCHKRVAEDCRDRFRIAGSLLFADGNVKNFRGEPHVPGSVLLALTSRAG